MWNRKLSGIVSVLVALAAAALSWAVWPGMPEQMPIHWGPHGTPDGFAPKAIGLSLMPVMALVMSLGLRLVAFRESEKTKALFGWTLAALAGFFFALHAMMIHAALTPGMALSLPAMFALIGVLLVVMAGLMTKTEPNRVMGYRMKATMNDPTVWNLVHRFAFKTITISSLAMSRASPSKASRRWFCAWCCSSRARWHRWPTPRCCRARAAERRSGSSSRARPAFSLCPRSALPSSR